MRYRHILTYSSNILKNIKGIPALGLITFAWGCVIGALGISGALAKVWFLGNYSYSLFTDRLLWRAAHLYDLFQVMGSETSGGGRIPGGILYYIVWLFQRISLDPAFIHAASVGLMIASSVVIFFIARRYIGWFAGLIAWVFYFAVASLTQQWDAVTLWNPSFGWRFGAGAYWAMSRCIVDRNSYFLAVSFGFVAAAAQI